MAHEPRRLIDRQARVLVEGARVPVGVVIPAILSPVVVELAHLHRPLPTELPFELALLLDLVAQVGQVEGHDVGGDIVEVEDGRGVEDVAV